ncbi:MAG: type IVB secretion system protein IcmH/DotU [Pseudomonadota bacterium]
MAPDDPFFGDGDLDRTIIRPMPGGRTTRTDEPATARPVVTAPNPAEPRPVIMGGADSGNALETLLGRSLNPLVNAAAPLLVLAMQIRSLTAHADVAGLHAMASGQVRRFETRAVRDGYTDDTVQIARYALCVFMDESVMGTPWGAESTWSSESLLSTFHNETWGGEKFFALIERLLQRPGSQLDLLDLFYLCLALGFRGKFGLSGDGLTQLSDIQADLYRTIQSHRGEYERELSPRWRGMEDRRNALERYVPLWVVGALAGVLLLVVYGGFRWVLTSGSEPLIQSMERVGSTPVVSETRAEPE